MVLDFNAFARNPQFRQSDWGVRNLQPGQQQAAQGQLSGSAYQAPGAGTLPQLPAVWASNAGQGAGFMAPAMPQGWEMQPASSMPGGGWSYSQQAPPGGGTPPPVDTSKLPGGPAPVTTSGLDQGYAQTGVQSGVTAPQATPLAGVLPGGGATNWTQQPEWMDGGYNLGWDYANGTFTPRNQAFDKGHIVGSEVGWQSGMALPVGYNASQDKYRGGLGGTETAIHKAIRIANDLVKNGQARSPQRALEYGMAFVQAEARRMGVTTGWDMNTLADQLGGYDESKSYFAGGTPGAPGTPGAGGTPGGAGTPPPAANPPAAGAGGSGGGAAGGTGDGTLTDANLALFSRDEKAATRWMLQQMGIDPDSPGYVTNFLTNLNRPRVQALQQLAGFTGGHGGDAATELEGLLRGLGSASMAHGTGGVGGYLRGLGQSALGNAGDYLRAAPDQDTQNFYAALNDVASTNANPLAQGARAQTLTRWMNQYGDNAVRTFQGERGLPQTFQEYMQRNNYSPFW